MSRRFAGQNPPFREKIRKQKIFGHFFGKLAVDEVCRFDKETKELEIIPYTNPAIFVPELRKIIFGCESWWTKINSVEELEETTDKKITSTWYVRRLILL